MRSVDSFENLLTIQFVQPLDGHPDGLALFASGESQSERLQTVAHATDYVLPDQSRTTIYKRLNHWIHFSRFGMLWKPARTIYSPVRIVIKTLQHVRVCHHHCDTGVVLHDLYTTQQFQYKNCKGLVNKKMAHKHTTQAFALIQQVLIL